MTAIREQVLAATAAILGGIPGYGFRRNAARPLSYADELPGFVQLDGGHSAPSLVTGADRYTLTVTVEIYVTADDEAQLGPLLNAAYAAATSALVADRTLGGLALDLREERMTDPEILGEEGQPTIMACGVDFTVDFWTAEGDPESPGP